MGTFSRWKDKLLGEKTDEFFDDPESQRSEYIEVNNIEGKSRAKIKVKPFVISEFGDIKPVLDSLREGYTITLVNIRPLKEKDIVELKRAINKLKKTCDAIEGDIAGFGEDWIVVTPSFAEVHRAPQAPRNPNINTDLEKF